MDRQSKNTGSAHEHALGYSADFRALALPVCPVRPLRLGHQDPDGALHAAGHRAPQGCGGHAMSTADKTKLRELAEKAGSGEWGTDGLEITADTRALVCCGRGGYGCCGEPDVD